MMVHRGIASYDDNGNWTDDSGGWGGGGYDSGGGVDWASIFTPITQAAGSIFKNVYGQPNLPEGTVLINGPNGSQMIRYPSGQMVPYVPGGTNIGIGAGGKSGGISPLILIGGLIAVAFVASNMGKR